MTDIAAARTRTHRRHRRRRRRGRARSRARRRARQEAARSRRCSKTLGAHDAGRAQGAGPADQRPEGPRSPRRSTRAARRCKGAALDARLATETRRRHAAGARGAGRDRPHPSDQPGDRRAHRDLRRHGLRGRRRSGHRDRRLQLHQAEFPRGPSGARDARHVLLQPEAGRLAASCCAPTPRRCRCAPC